LRLRCALASLQGSSALGYMCRSVRFAVFAVAEHILTFSRLGTTSAAIAWLGIEHFCGTVVWTNGAIANSLHGATRVDSHLYRRAVPVGHQMRPACCCSVRRSVRATTPRLPIFFPHGLSQLVPARSRAADVATILFVQTGFNGSRNPLR
jgi:hypothetical protein